MSLVNDNSLSVTFVNNKAFGCSILYVRFGNSVRDNFPVICLWLDVLPDLSVLYSNNDINGNYGGTYQSKSAY